MDDTTSWMDVPDVAVDGTTSWKDLPIVLLTDILLRLPVKTLIRSTSVCKTWYAFIRNPNFITTHLNRSISGDHYLLFIPTTVCRENSCSVICEKTFVEHSKLEIPFRAGTLSDPENVLTVGSCNGLICLTDYSLVGTGRKIVLWNPSVRKYKVLTSSSFSDQIRDWRKISPIVGFGFHKPTNDYRIVRIAYLADHTGTFYGKVPPEVEVYSLRTDSWRRVGGAFRDLRSKHEVPRKTYNGHVVFVNGAIHWLVAKKANGPFETVMSFDLNIELFQEVKLPPKYKKGIGEKMYVLLMEFKGSLSLFVFGISSGGSQRCCLWVMAGDGAAVSWTKQYNVVLRERVGWPLGFTKSGKLLLQTVDGKLVSYDLGNLQFKDFGTNGPRTMHVAAFMENLVLLEGSSGLLAHTKLTDHGFF